MIGLHFIWNSILSDHQILLSLTSTLFKAGWVNKYICRHYLLIRPVWEDKYSWVIQHTFELTISKNKKKRQKTRERTSNNKCIQGFYLFNRSFIPGIKGGMEGLFCEPLTAWQLCFAAYKADEQSFQQFVMILLFC